MTVDKNEKMKDEQRMNEISSLSDIYESLFEDQEILVIPVRMKEERLFIPTDDEEFAILGADYFFIDSPLMLFAPKLVMEAWFFAGRTQPGKVLPIEVHVPVDLESQHGGVPIRRMKFITEKEYAEMVSDIQEGRVSKYRTK